METTHFIFGAGKLAIIIEAKTELEACKKYVALVESKGNESDWDFNRAYIKAINFINKQSQ
jgi:hypothetical protein